MPSCNFFYLMPSRVKFDTTIALPKRFVSRFQVHIRVYYLGQRHSRWTFDKQHKIPLVLVLISKIRTFVTTTATATKFGDFS